MRVIVAGGTGFIGRALCRRLADCGHDVVVLSRSVNTGDQVLSDEITFTGWDARTPEGWGSYIEDGCAIVNLTGENIGAGRWDENHKRRILESRLGAGKAILDAVQQGRSKPAAVVQGSAVGYYGHRGEEIVDESAGPGRGFLASVVEQMEETAAGIQKMGVRLILARTGVILGREGGMLPRLMRPFRYYVGGPPGTGNQWISWIHLDDEVRSILFLLEREDLEGAFNLTAPGHVRMRDLCLMIGISMGRPSWFRTPPFLLRFVFGEMADEVILSGARVQPRRLSDAGFRFSYEDAASAVENLLP